MQNRLLSQSAILGLSLGALVVATTLTAHAEPTPSSERQEASAASADASEETSEKTSEVKTKVITLAADTDTKEHRVNRPLMLTSSVLFATGYVPALITTLANSKATSGWLGVPVVGPWVDWGPHTSPGNKVLLFSSGLLQAVGVVGMVTSFFVPESKTKKVPMMGKRHFNVSPVAGRGVYSLSATGTF